MSLYIIDLLRVRQWAYVVANVDPSEASELWGDRCRWRVCPECLWITLSVDPNLPCRRDPLHDVVSYGGMFGRHPSSCPQVPLSPVPDHVGDALWGALRLGGMNAVVEMLGTLVPERLGLLSAVDKLHQRKGLPR